MLTVCEMLRLHTDVLERGKRADHAVGHAILIALNYLCNMSLVRSAHPVTDCQSNSRRLSFRRKVS